MLIYILNKTDTSHRMEYSAEFERDLSQLEAIAAELQTTEDGSDEHRMAQQDLTLFLDDIINKFPVPPHRVRNHVAEISRIYRTREHESTASKHAATVHEVFLDDVCDDYDPLY